MDFQDIINIRQQLHQNPEPAFKEFETQETLKTYLSSLSLVNLWELAGTGLLVQVCGSSRNPGLLYRTDIDALPIQEENDISYKSNREGFAHLCGHDGHASIALGLIKSLVANPPKRPVYVLFQPAEETGMGAKEVLKDSVFSSIPFTGAYALHNLPGKELGKICYAKDFFSASVTSFAMRLKGKFSHAAEPFNGINPGFIIGDLLQFMREESKAESPDKFRFITPVGIKVGSADYGINPGRGELHVTLRAAGEKKFEKLKKKFLAKAEELCANAGAELDYEELEHFAATEQDAKLESQFLKIAEGLDAELLPGPNRWGEDFGFYKKQCPTYMFGVGSGINQPALHHQNYDFPDQIIEPIVNFLTELFHKSV